MPTIFLSYSQKNVEEAALLEQELTSRGITVWRDQGQLRAGERWPKALGEAIAAAVALLLLWSRDAAQSSFVELEWTTALALKKPILPLLIDDAALPSSLAATQAIPSSPLAKAADQIIAALNRGKLAQNLQANQAQVIDQLAGIQGTNPSDVLKEFRTIQGSVYQAGRDIYVGTPAPSIPAPKSALEKWQSWVAIVAGLLTAITLGLALWHNVVPIKATTSLTSQKQPFAGHVSSANGPLTGVTVSLEMDGKSIGSYTTDDLGHFEFHVAAQPDADITLFAQKNGFRTEKRYAKLGNTNFNFEMSGVRE